MPVFQQVMEGRIRSRMFLGREMPWIIIITVTWQNQNKDLGKRFRDEMELVTKNFIGLDMIRVMNNDTIVLETNDYT